ncbi:unnamed protein product [Prunus armeniaca]
MLGGSAMKVARSGHGTLRWYDDGRGQRGGSSHNGVADVVRQLGFMAVELPRRLRDRRRSSFGPSRIEPSRRFCSSYACFQPWLFGRLQWIGK